MTAPRTSRSQWSLNDLGPDMARVARVLLLLALVGGAVLITSQIMQRAQAPARRLFG